MRGAETAGSGSSVGGRTAWQYAGQEVEGGRKVVAGRECPDPERDHRRADGRLRVEGLREVRELAGDAVLVAVIRRGRGYVRADGERVSLPGGGGARFGVRVELAHVERRQDAREQEIVDGERDENR